MPAKPITLLKHSTGLNNVVDPTRVPFDPERGVGSFAAATNVEYDQSGMAMRRKGYTKKVDLPVHALAASKNICLFTSGSDLYRLREDFSYVKVRSLMTEGLPLYVETVAGRCYYSNTREMGYVEGENSYPWEFSKYIGPDTNKTYCDPPVCSIIRYFNSRLYLACGNTVFFSAPFAYGWFDISSDFVQFESRVRMMQSVDDGLYIATDDTVFFLQGSDGPELRVLPRATTRVVEGTDAQIINNLDTGLPQQIFQGRAVLFTAEDGIYVGGAEGWISNLTADSLKFPSTARGTSLVNKKKELITLLHP